MRGPENPAGKLIYLTKFGANRREIVDIDDELAEETMYEVCSRNAPPPSSFIEYTTQHHNSHEHPHPRLVTSAFLTHRWASSHPTRSHRSRC